MEALRDKQLQEYEKFQKQDKSTKEKTNKDQLEKIKKELLSYKIKPNLNNNKDLAENLKLLSKQLEKIKIQNVLKDKNDIQGFKNWPIAIQMLYANPDPDIFED